MLLKFLLWLLLLVVVAGVFILGSFEFIARASTGAAGAAAGGAGVAIA